MAANKNTSMDDEPILVTADGIWSLKADGTHHTLIGQQVVYTDDEIKAETARMLREMESR